MEYKHFSHHHNLNLYQTQPGQQIHCSGCERPCTNSSYYACFQCNFFLHEHCGNANRFVKHPSHPHHPLVLLPSPTYCGGRFSCNGCGETGNTFSYSCALCEVDLHVHCAFLPFKVNHISHAHELSLTYRIQKELEEDASHSCRLCPTPLQSKQWSYTCLECNFLVHTFCATNEVKPGLYLDDHNDSDSATPNAAQAEVSQMQSPHQNAAETVNNQPGNERSEESFAAELLNMQLQMQMAEQFAQMMASFNPASLV